MRPCGARWVVHGPGAYGRPDFRPFFPLLCRADWHGTHAGEEKFPVQPRRIQVSVSDGNLSQTHGMRAFDFREGLHLAVQPKDFTLHSSDQHPVLVMDDKVGEEGYSRRQTFVHGARWGRLYVNARLGHFQIGRA